MNSSKRRIALNVGAGYVPGMNAVIKGVALAAGKWGWDAVGIKDGFAGLLFPDRYPDGGLVPLDLQTVKSLDQNAGGFLGQAARVDPFHVRRVDEDNMVEELDLSGEILERLDTEGIDALISVVGGRGLSILHKLHRKGLNAVCIPRSIENDIAATSLSFGFNSALSFTIEMLDRTRQAAQSAQQVAVVEVLGKQSGWLALQSGIAAGADAVLIPEISPDLQSVATRLEDKMTSGDAWGLVVVAEGVRFPTEAPTGFDSPGSLQASLSPLATGEAGEHVIQSSGNAARTVAEKLQMLAAVETYPLVLGPWVRGGTPSAVDRQLGLCYGSGAVRAVRDGERGVMVAFNPPDIEFVPLVEAINKVRAVPLGGGFIQVAQSLGITLGGEL